MDRLFVPLAVLTSLMLAYSPVLIASAPYESTMDSCRKSLLPLPS